MFGPLAPAQLGPLGRATTRSYQAIVTGIANCISYLPLNDTSGTTAVDAVLGTNSTYNSCTLNNLAGPGGSMGNAPLFDGTSSFVQLPASALSSGFDATKGTLSIWVNLNEAWSVSGPRYANVIGVDVNNFVLTGKDGANVTAFYYKAGGTTNGFEPAAPSAGWHNFAQTWDKTANQFINYIDGVKQGTTHALNGTWSGSLANAFCMLGKFNGGSFWKGWLQGAALFSRALTQAEITTLATAV